MLGFPYNVPGKECIFVSRISSPAIQRTNYKAIVIVVVPCHCPHNYLGRVFFVGKIAGVYDGFHEFVLFLVSIIYPSWSSTDFCVVEHNVVEHNLSLIHI